MSDDTTRGGSVPTEPRAAQPDDTQALATGSGGARTGKATTSATPSTGQKGSGRSADSARHASGPRYGGPGADRGPAAARRAEGPEEPPGGTPTTVLPGGGAGRPARPGPSRAESRPAASARSQARAAGRRRARLVLQRVDPWSVFLFSLVASICLGVVLLAAVASLYAALSSLGVLDSLNGVLGEVAGTGAPDEVVEPFITSGRVLSAAAVLAAVDVVLLTALATLGALLYNLCASLTGGIEVQLGERE